MLCHPSHVCERFCSTEEDVLGDVVDPGADGAQGHAGKDVRVVALPGLEDFAVHLKDFEFNFVLMILDEMCYKIS